MRRMACVAITGTMIVAHPGPAFAGTNGQQLAIEPNCDSNWAFVQGHNQSGRWVTEWVVVPAAVPEGGCWGTDTYDSGWWWKGWVRIDGYWNKGSGYAGTYWVYVPTDEGSYDNWFYTQVP
jgi:hypothetical protein